MATYYIYSFIELNTEIVQLVTLLQTPGSLNHPTLLLILTCRILFAFFLNQMGELWSRLIHKSAAGFLLA